MAICLHPITIRSPGKGLKGKWQYINVPCGRCPSCLKNRQQDWAFRIQMEAQECLSKNGCVYFVTFTYDDDHLTFGENDRATLVPSDISHFIKVYRDYMRRMFDCSVRFFAAGEYGEDDDFTHRPHYHVVFFFDKPFQAVDLRDAMQERWLHGQILKIAPISVKLAEYVAKYSTKQYGIDYDGVCPPFARMSLRPAIGKCFIEKNRDFYRKNELFHTFDSSGTPFRIPRYIRDRIFDLDQVDDYVLRLQHKFDLLEDCKRAFCIGNYFKETRDAAIQFETNFYDKLKKLKNYGL